MSDDTTPNFDTNPCAEVLTGKSWRESSSIGADPCAEFVEALAAEFAIAGAARGKSILTSLGSRVTLATIENKHTPGGVAYLFEFDNPIQEVTTRIATSREGAWALFRLLGEYLVRPHAPDHRMDVDFVWPEQWAKHPRPKPEDSEAVKAT